MGQSLGKTRVGDGATRELSLSLGQNLRYFLPPSIAKLRFVIEKKYPNCQIDYHKVNIFDMSTMEICDILPSCFFRGWVKIKKKS